MLLADARDDVVRTCRSLLDSGLVVGTSGNVSTRSGDLVAVSPTGLDYRELTAALVGVHRLDGSPVEAHLQPTSELPLHLAVYAATSAKAIVHTHSPAATTVSAIATELPAIHYLVAMFGGPVPVAPYATYGSEELAGHVARVLRDRTACVMANHGAVTTGSDLRAALTASQYLEWLCDVYLRALSAGTPRLLPQSEIERVAVKLTGYGQQRP